jgi:hypothetical protein
MATSVSRKALGRMGLVLAAALAYAPSSSADERARSLPGPVGTFRARSPAPGQLALLVLMTDRRAHAETEIRCVRHPCERPKLEGTFRVGVRPGGAGTGRITFRWRGSRKEATFAYEYSERRGTLRLREAGKNWQSLRRDARGWCGRPSDCERQNLPTPRCLGAWSCAENTCAYFCGGAGRTCRSSADCRSGEQCYGPEGCDARWTCGTARMCTRDLVTFCGCDGQTFQASSSCPNRKYKNRGACAGATTCKKTGCSGQVCADRDMITTCEMRPEYACYRTAECKVQADGRCGWTQTDALRRCLANPPRVP